MPATPSRFAEFDAELDSPSTKCRVCVFLRDAAKTDAEFITALLLNPDKGHTHIAKVLTAGGVKVTPKVVVGHRTNHMPS